MVALRRLVPVTLIWALMAVGVSAASADTSPSGTIIAVVQSAEVDGTTGRKVLQPAANVFSGDRIITGGRGEAQIRFLDDTKLVVGPNSSMVIDAFVFNSDATARKISINAVRGAFRFITGNSAKDAYSITTPTATIGVRGTQFDFTVDRLGGTTRVLEYEGITRICKRLPTDQGGAASRDCIELRATCSVATVYPRNNIDESATREARNDSVNRYFRYALNQTRLQPAFQVNTAACGNLAPIVAPFQSPSGGAPPPPPPPDPGD